MFAPGALGRHSGLVNGSGFVRPLQATQKREPALEILRLSDENIRLQRERDIARAALGAAGFGQAPRNGAGLSPSMDTQDTRTEAHNNVVACLERELAGARDVIRLTEQRALRLEAELSETRDLLTTSQEEALRLTTDVTRVRAELNGTRKVQSDKTADILQLERELFLLRQEHASCARAGYEMSRLKHDQHEARTGEEESKRLVVSLQADLRASRAQCSESRLALSVLQQQVDDEVERSKRYAADLGTIVGRKREVNLLRARQAQAEEKYSALQQAHRLCGMQRGVLEERLRVLEAAYSEVKVAHGVQAQVTERTELVARARRIVAGFTPYVGMAFVRGPQGGVGVLRVAPGSPAHAAGLKHRDVVLSVNGRVTTRKAHVVAALYRLMPGTSVPVVYKRRPCSVRGGLVKSFDAGCLDLSLGPHSCPGPRVGPGCVATGSASGCHAGDPALLTMLTVGAKGLSLDDVHALNKLARRDDSDFDLDFARLCGERPPMAEPEPEVDSEEEI